MDINEREGWRLADAGDVRGNREAAEAKVGLLKFSTNAPG
jgi:hypothetical protein